MRPGQVQLLAGPSAPLVFLAPVFQEQIVHGLGDALPPPMHPDQQFYQAERTAGVLSGDFRRQGRGEVLPPA